MDSSPNCTNDQKLTMTNRFLNFQNEVEKKEAFQCCKDSINEFEKKDSTLINSKSTFAKDRMKKTPLILSAKKLNEKNQKDNLNFSLNLSKSNQKQSLHKKSRSNCDSPLELEEIPSFLTCKSNEIKKFNSPPKNIEIAHQSNRIPEPISIIQRKIPLISNNLVTSSNEEIHRIKIQPHSTKLNQNSNINNKTKPIVYDLFNVKNNVKKINKYNII